MGKFSCGKTILRPSSSLNLTRSKAVSSPGYLDSWDKIYSKRNRISLSHWDRSAAAAAAAAAAVGVPRKTTRKQKNCLFYFQALLIYSKD